MRWNLKAFLIAVPLLAALLVLVIQHFQKPPHDGTAALLGPITSGTSLTLSPPKEIEFVRAIERIYKTKGGQFSTLKIDRNVPLKIEKVSSKLDAQKVHPLIGPARLHHQIWQCEFGVKRIDGTTEKRSITIDQNHFHLGGPPKASSSTGSDGS